MSIPKNNKSTFRDYRVEAREKVWGCTVPKGKTLTREQLHTGCLLRIADATESMARTHIALQEHIDRQNERIRHMKIVIGNFEEQNKALKRSHASLRGVITRMKRQHKWRVEKLEQVLLDDGIVVP